MREHKEIWFKVGASNLAELLAAAAKEGFVVDPHQQPKPVLKDGDSWLVYDAVKEL